MSVSGKVLYKRITKKKKVNDKHKLRKEKNFRYIFATLNKLIFVNLF